MTGRLIGVVGPSGVGKDSLMQALASTVTGFTLIRRVITRDGDAGGEDFEAVTEAEFETRRAAGEFCLHWQAHGLSYGIPKSVKNRVAKGEEVLVNLSRDVLTEISAIFPRVAVLNVTARPETLAARLADRGRETPEEIAARLARKRTLPEGLDILTIHNDGPLEDAVDEALAWLHPVRA